MLISNRKTHESINLTDKGKYIVKFRMVVGKPLISIVGRLKDRINKGKYNYNNLLMDIQIKKM